MLAGLLAMIIAGVVGLTFAASQHGGDDDDDYRNCA